MTASDSFHLPFIYSVSNQGVLLLQGALHWGVLQKNGG